MPKKRETLCDKIYHHYQAESPQTYSGTTKIGQTNIGAFPMQLEGHTLHKILVIFFLSLNLTIRKLSDKRNKAIVKDSLQNSCPGILQK